MVCLMALLVDVFRRDESVFTTLKVYSSGLSQIRLQDSRRLRNMRLLQDRHNGPGRDALLQPSAYLGSPERSRIAERLLAALQV